MVEREKEIGPRTVVCEFTHNGKRYIEYLVPIEKVGRSKMKLSIYEVGVEDQEIARILGNYIPGKDGGIFVEVRTDNFTTRQKNGHRRVVRTALKETVLQYPQSHIRAILSANYHTMFDGMRLWHSLSKDPQLKVVPAGALRIRRQLAAKKAA